MTTAGSDGEVFRLEQYRPAPVQRSAVSCGPAVLTMARLLHDLDFARWLRTGQGDPEPGAPLSSSPDTRTRWPTRWAAYERWVHAAVTSAVTPAGRWQLPWPRRLGTPPWALAGELARTGWPPGTRPHIRWVRGRRAAGLERVHRQVAAVVGAGLPAALYVGNRWLPRHVALLVSIEGALCLYDPGSGTVSDLNPVRWVSACLDVGGWCRPWFLVEARV